MGLKEVSLDIVHNVVSHNDVKMIQIIYIVAMYDVTL